jgi:hypothetical protein
MSDAAAPNPNLRKALGASLLVTALVALWSSYVKSANPNPPAWMDLPFGLFLIVLGLRFWLTPDPMLSTGVRRAFAIVPFALGASIFVRFFV